MLSIVIPVYNEEESLEALHRELHEVADAEGYQLDIVFVDDGSRDGSWQIIQKLAAEDPCVRGCPVSPQFRQGGGSRRRFCPCAGANW